MKFQTKIETPIGILKIINNESAITNVIFTQEIFKTKENEITKIAKKQLLDFFDKKITKFKLPLNPAGTTFEKTTWQYLQQIKFGKICSYTDIALKFNDKNKVRAIGKANSKNPIAIIIPCHRVIGKNGKLVGYAGGLERKRWLLNFENEVKQQSLF